MSADSPPTAASDDGGRAARLAAWIAKHPPEGADFFRQPPPTPDLAAFEKAERRRARKIITDRARRMRQEVRDSEWLREYYRAGLRSVDPAEAKRYRDQRNAAARRRMADPAYRERRNAAARARAAAARAARPLPAPRDPVVTAALAKMWSAGYYDGGASRARSLPASLTSAERDAYGRGVEAGRRRAARDTEPASTAAVAKMRAAGYYDGRTGRARPLPDSLSLAERDAYSLGLAAGRRRSDRDA